MMGSVAVLVIECVECGETAAAAERGWQALLVEDPDGADPPEVALYCPACAEREFGSRSPR
jgi:hypothetical protein